MVPDNHQGTLYVNGRVPDAHQEAMKKGLALEISRGEIAVVFWGSKVAPSSPARAHYSSDVRGYPPAYVLEVCRTFGIEFVPVAGSG